MTKIRNKTERKKREKKKPYLEIKNEVCLLFPNFKPASNQTKIKSFFKLFLL